MGGCLMGMYLTGVYLMSVCLLAVYLMSVHLISMHLTPAMSVNRLSLQLFNNYNAVQAHANAAPNPAAVSAIQLQVINACVPANFTNHANEVFTPLGCPGFGIKARWLRCQAMFHYNPNVAPNLVNLERAWRSREAPLNLPCQRRGVHLIGIHLIGVYLIVVYLMGVCLKTFHSPSSRALSMAAKSTKTSATTGPSPRS
jgi:hypothetical protein